MSRKVAKPELRIARATYHGGFSFLPQMEPKVGRLVLDDETLRLDRVQNERFTREYPPFEICRAHAIAAMDITSEQVARSKLGAAFFFGVLGAVTAKAGQDRATVIIYLKSGEKGYLTIDGQSVASLLGSLEPWMREKGITLGAPPDELDRSTIPDPVEQLKKLAELHQRGLLTDEEFAAKRAAIVDRL